LDVSQLKRIPLFAEVPDEALQKIAPFATSEEWPEGKEIVKEGGFSNHFYAIEEGSAKVEREGEHLADLSEGDIFGEQGLLEHSERSATVTSTSDIRLIKIEHWELSRMKKAMPEAYEDLVKKVEERSS
jgi:cAMP-dependent protein kinase regulator/CRP/FNR family cyclic AMP-dependent transcriptional regulator/cGMP-dependent protein kinase 2